MRLRRAINLAREEALALRRASDVSGGHDALVARVLQQLKLESIDEQRIASLEARLASLEIRRSEMEDRLRESDRLRSEAISRIDEMFASLPEPEPVPPPAPPEPRDRTGELAARIGSVTAWVQHARLTGTTLLSIVLVTHDRSALLRRAIDSVVAQTYPYWELIVVDDGSTDDTAEVLRELSAQDHRIRVVAQAHHGVGFARNNGLSHASADIVCYLDDDNSMQPDWLKAVAWSFERHPDLELLYGARIMDVESFDASGMDVLPRLQLEPFDRRRLEVGNYIDLGVIAHLRALPQAFFDESLEALGDWDLLLRLTEDRDPFVLPVVALHYSTSAPNRITRSGRFNSAELAIRARMLRERPMRVLAYNSLFPLVTENYIAEEMRALTDNGATLAWCTEHWMPSPSRVEEPWFRDLDEAVAEFDPDLLFIYWSTFADHQLDRLSDVGRPFALRIHSFDFEPEVIERIRDHPLCVGVWAYPHHAELIPGTQPLVALLTSGATFPVLSESGSIVVSIGPALPKRDWPGLVEAFAELASEGVDCRIVVGITSQFEEEPERIRALINQSGAPIMLSVDIPHEQVIELLGRAAVVVYTKQPGGPFGMPGSVIEGMYAGTSVIMPERPESRLVAGPDCRTYGRPRDIVRHAREILAGGPEIDAERRRNRQFAEEHFADPGLASAFAGQLSKALAEWHSR